MSGKAIAMVLDYGFPGKWARGPRDYTEAKTVKSDSANIPFGCPVVLNSGNTISHPASVTLTAANFAGVAVGEIKQFNTYVTGQDTTQQNFYSPNQMADVMQQGGVMVKVVHGTPTAGGAVYVRTVLNGSFPAEAIGDFRADSDSTNTVQLTNCVWHSGLMDTKNVCELKIRTINN